MQDCVLRSLLYADYDDPDAFLWNNLEKWNEKEWAAVTNLIKKFNRDIDAACSAHQPWSIEVQAILIATLLAVFMRSIYDEGGKNSTLEGPLLGLINRVIWPTLGLSLVPDRGSMAIH